MLPQIKISSQKLEKYKNIVPSFLLKEIKNLSKNFQGLRVVHINSTPRGGGVAEVLKSLVPLMRGVGIQAEWYVIPPGSKFFGLTKEIHNAFQGKKVSLSDSFQKLYQYYIRRFAKLMLDMKADVWIFHDPQPLGLVQFLPDLNSQPRIARIHIDTSAPNAEAWNFMKSFLLEFDKIIFSAKEFVHKDLPKKKIAVFPPAIDPLIEKNNPISLSAGKEILKSFGINAKKPLISQISRFDPWKDPIGVIRAYKLARKRIPNLQLALVGLFLAHDDPEAEKVFKEVKKEIKKDKNIFLFSNPDELGSLKIDRFVNAFQVGSDVILQKSIKEGFGLTVSEAMWKEKAVIGGNTGGIKLQIKNGKNGFLVSTPRETAQRVIELIENPCLRKKLGKAGKETVRKNFLIPRLLKDYLKLFEELVHKR